MCYRTSVPGRELLEKRFNAQFSEDIDFKRRYHVSSFDIPKLPVIIDKEPLQIQLFHWGIIPFWTKNEESANEIRLKTMNARSESIYEKPSFRSSAEKKHCLVLVDGFYEWQDVNGKKYPYYIRLKNHEPFALAGLWESWKNKTTDNEIKTFTVITTRANLLMEKIHNKKKRMPVILKREDESLWIKEDVDKDTSLSFLTPFEQSEMEAFTISKLITSRDADPNVPEVMEPFSYPELENNIGQSKLF